MSKWSEEEDAKLRNLVSEFGEGNWKVISQHVENRSYEGIKKRWIKINPNVASGKWELEEDVTLIDWIITLASNSVNTFKLAGKPRSRNDVNKRILYYKDVLSEQVCGSKTQKMSKEYNKIRKRNIKDQLKQKNEDDVKTIVKQDIEETSLKNCKIDPEIYNDYEERKIENTSSEPYDVLIKK